MRFYRENQNVNDTLRSLQTTNEISDGKAAIFRSVVFQTVHPLLFSLVSRAFHSVNLPCSRITRNVQLFVWQCPVPLWNYFTRGKTCGNARNVHPVIWRIAVQHCRTCRYKRHVTCDFAQRNFPTKLMQICLTFHPRNGKSTNTSITTHTYRRFLFNLYNYHSSNYITRRFHVVIFDILSNLVFKSVLISSFLSFTYRLKMIIISGELLKWHVG